MTKTWNYRLIRFPTHIALHEVHYEDGEPVSRTIEPATFVSETAEDLIAGLERALSDAKTRPVLDADEIGRAP